MKTLAVHSVWLGASRSPGLSGAEAVQARLSRLSTYLQHYHGLMQRGERLLQRLMRFRNLQARNRNSVLGRYIRMRFVQLSVVLHARSHAFSYGSCPRESGIWPNRPVLCILICCFATQRLMMLDQSFVRRECVAAIATATPAPQTALSVVRSRTTLCRSGPSSCIIWSMSS